MESTLFWKISGEGVLWLQLQPCSITMVPVVCAFQVLAWTAICYSWSCLVVMYARADRTNTCIYRRLGRSKPGNCFVSFVRVYARSGSPGGITTKMYEWHFSCRLRGLPLFPGEWKWCRSELKWVQVSSCEFKWIPVSSSEFKWLQVSSSSEFKKVQVSPSECKWV